MNRTTRFLKAAGISLALAFTFSCSSDSNGGGGGSCDIKDYRTVEIGSQTWMAENLNCNVSGSKCNDKGCDAYGRFYDWNTARTVCPSGWHLPSQDEWQTLVNYVGGNSTAGTKLKARSGWIDEDGDTSNGTDDYGFSVLPAGITDSQTGKIIDVGEAAQFWSDTEDMAETDRAHTMDIEGSYAYTSDSRNKSRWCSVRCVKD